MFRPSSSPSSDVFLVFGKTLEKHLFECHAAAENKTAKKMSPFIEISPDKFLIIV